MGQRGPTPEPTALKELKGNPGKRSLNRNEPKYSACPDPPDWLEGEALREWNRIAPHLEPLGLLTVADRAELVLYCEAWADYRELRRRVQQEGWTVHNDKGAAYQNPTVGAMNKASERVHRYAKEFGFTPSSRQSISVDKQPADPDDDFDL